MEDLKLLCKKILGLPATGAVLLAALLMTTACGSGGEGESAATGEARAIAEPATAAEGRPAILEESWTSPRDTADNVDSPAVWHGSEGEHWVLATAKETDVILAYDAATGETAGRLGGSGNARGELRRPNGIAVIDDWLFVVERDNHRVQVFELPGFRSAGMFGSDDLTLPYGITAFREGGVMQLYVTDNYEMAGDQIPPDSLLGRRVRHYALRFDAEGTGLNATLENTFGDTSGEGVLTVVESIYADPFHGRLLIADEEELDVKIYDLEGRFTGRTMGAGLFKYEPEGIALYGCTDGSGYWVMTDQSEGENLFYIFDRRSLQHLGTFTGESTLNTDGIALTQRAFGPFDRGAFFPVDNDGSVNALSWTSIADALELKINCTQ